MARRSWLPEPSDVVSGRVRVTIEQLFALIHQVNPTDQGLGARQQAEGYALKSRLQSLLVRQYPDLLAVERHPVQGFIIHRVSPLPPHGGLSWPRCGLVFFGVCFF